MPYSRQLRRLVHASRELFEEHDVERPTGSLTVENSVPHSPRLPTRVPLDRKRAVDIESMTHEDLIRAHGQAERRIKRTKPSADLDRYNLQLQAIDEALKSSATSDTQPPNEHTERLNNDAMVAQMVTEMEGQTSSRQAPFGDRTIASGASDRAGGPPRFTSDPRDTYPD